MVVINMRKENKESRSRIMASIKGKDTKIELTLRKLLWKKGYRYRKNYSKLPGTPDIVFIKEKIAIFCDGEFWHGYHWEENKVKIKTNRTFWIKKINKNIERDKKINTILESQGWTVVRFWGKEIIDNPKECIKTIEFLIKTKRNTR